MMTYGWVVSYVYFYDYSRSIYIIRMYLIYFVHKIDWYVKVYLKIKIAKVGITNDYRMHALFYEI